MMSGSNCKTHLMKDTNREITKSCGVRIANILENIVTNSLIAYGLITLFFQMASVAMERGEANDGEFKAMSILWKTCEHLLFICD